MKRSSFESSATKAIRIALFCFVPHLLAQEATSIVFSTHYGGSGGDDCDAVEVDRLGNTYLGCHSDSQNIPGSDEFKYTINGEYDAFIVKLDPNANAVGYIRHLGGSDWEAVQGITSDALGNIYAVGATYSADFPTSDGALQAVFGGKSDAFVVKLNAIGEVVWSTFFGGSEDEDGRGIFLDHNGNVHISGRTASMDFVTTSNAVQRVPGGGTDAFVASFDTDGQLIYSSYLGGSGYDTGFDIIVDTSGRLFISGFTNSTDFPVQNALYSESFGNDDAFITVLHPNGSAIEFSSYLGGSGYDRDVGIGLDASGDVIVAGYTTSSDLATTSGAAQPIFSGNYDVFVARLNVIEPRLVYMTYLGGSGLDRMRKFIIDGSGNVVLVGQTNSTDFPVGQNQRINFGANYNGFVTILNNAGSEFLNSLLMGGQSDDAFEAVALGRDESLTIVGMSSSADFPTRSPLQTGLMSGRSDAVVVRLLLH